MATIHSALATVKSQYSKLVPESMICRACVDVGHHWRRRKLDPAMTVHLLLLQLLARVALISLDQVAHVGVSAVAICRARMRLPLLVWMRLAELVGLACAGDDDTQGYCGHKTYLLDGTTFTTPDTPELAGKYGKASNQKKTKPGFPIPKLLALMNLASGAIPRVIDLPHARGEQTVLARMLRMLSPGDLLLGDRGLVSFAHVALMMRAGIHCLIRLPRCMVVHGRGNGGRGGRGGQGIQETPRAAWPAGSSGPMEQTTAVQTLMDEQVQLAQAAGLAAAAADRLLPASQGVPVAMGVDHHHAGLPGEVHGPVPGRTVRQTLGHRGCFPSSQTDLEDDQALGEDRGRSQKADPGFCHALQSGPPLDERGGQKTGRGTGPNQLQRCIDCTVVSGRG